MSESNKTQSNWKVCKSKRFADKVYYFNVNTGVSCWDPPEGEDFEKFESDSDGNQRNEQVRQTLATSPNEIVVNATSDHLNNNLDLRQVINQKKYQKMDYVIPATNSTKNLAQNRMNRFRNSLANDLSQEESPKKKICVEKIEKSPTKNNNGINQSRKRKIDEEVTPPPPHNDKQERVILKATKRFSVNDRLRRTPNNNSHNDDDDVDMTEINETPEQMEWEPISEEKILETITDMRRESTDLRVPAVQPVEMEKSDKTKLHIVIDTNIFLSDLSFVRHILLEYHYDSLGEPVIIVPWIVLQELDYIKDRKNDEQLAYFARKAINYLNDCFMSKSSKFYGQSAVDSSKELMKTECPDDKIMNCCLQTLERASNVVLLSNDKNLRSKCLVTNIRACSKDEILKSIGKNLPQDQIQPKNNNNFSNNKRKYDDSSESSIIARAPNRTINKNETKSEECKQIELYLIEILKIYTHYSEKILEIFKNHRAGGTVDRNSFSVKMLPKVVKNLLTLIDTLTSVVQEPFYFVTLTSFKSFAKIIEDILSENNIECSEISVKIMGNFCRTERAQLLAIKTRLKSALTILQQAQMLL